MNEINKNKLFGQIAIKLGYVTIQEIEKILIKQETDEITGIRKHIGKYLYEEGILTKEQISHILKLQNKYIEKLTMNQIDDSIASTENKTILNFKIFLHRFSTFNIFIIIFISIIFALFISYIHEHMILEFNLHKLGINDSRLIADYIQKNLVNKPFDPYLVCSNLPVPIFFCLLISYNFNSIFIRSFFCLLGFLLSLIIYSIPRAIFWDSPIFALIVLHLTLIIIGFIFYKKIKINNNESTNIIDNNLSSETNKSSEKKSDLPENLFEYKFERKFPYEYIVWLAIILSPIIPLSYYLYNANKNLINFNYGFVITCFLTIIINFLIFNFDLPTKYPLRLYKNKILLYLNTNVIISIEKNNIKNIEIKPDNSIILIRTNDDCDMIINGFLGKLQYYFNLLYFYDKKFICILNHRLISSIHHDDLINLLKIEFLNYITSYEEINFLSLDYFKFLLPYGWGNEVKGIFWISIFSYSLFFFINTIIIIEDNTIAFDGCQVLAKQILKYEQNENKHVKSKYMLELIDYINDIDNITDPWGNRYEYDVQKRMVYSKGSDKKHSNINSNEITYNHDDIFVYVDN